jgi:hypothetical protein
MTSTPSSGALAHGVHAPGHHPQGVDVEAGVGLVEDGQLGSSMAICRISLRFFSPPEKPSLRWRLANAGSMPSLSIHSIISRRTSRTDIVVPSGRHGLAQELDDRHALDRLGVLEGQEQMPALPRTSVAQCVMSSPWNRMEPDVTV